MEIKSLTLKTPYPVLIQDNHYLDLYLFDYMAEYTYFNTFQVLNGNMLPKSLREPFREILNNSKPQPGEIFISNSSRENHIDDYESLSIFYAQIRSEIELYELLQIWSDTIDHIFSNPGGDDDTFDYIPHYIYLFQDLLRQLFGEETLEQHMDHLKTINPEFPEFFD